MCLITFQSTRQSATPLSGSHHPENYSFILEQLELPVYTAIFPVFPPLAPSLVSPPPTLFYSLPSSPFDRRRLRCCSSKSIFFFLSFLFFPSLSPSLFLPFFLYLSRFLPFQGGENPGRESSPVFALLKSIVNIYPVIVTGGTHKGGGMSLRGEEIFVLLERNRQRDMIRGKGGLGSDGYTVWII